MADEIRYLIDLDGFFVETNIRPLVPVLAQEIERQRIKAGLDIDELLTALREERTRYVAEMYGEAQTGGDGPVRI